MRLTVGDATIANPIAWDLADVKLEFPAEQAGSTEQASQGQTNHIKHIFRNISLQNETTSDSSPVPGSSCCLQ